MATAEVLNDMPAETEKRQTAEQHFTRLLGDLSDAYAIEVNLANAAAAMDAIRQYVRRNFDSSFNPLAPHAPDELDSDVFHDLLENYGMVEAGLAAGPSGLKEIHAYIREFAATWRKK